MAEQIKPLLSNWEDLPFSEFTSDSMTLYLSLYQLRVVRAVVQEKKEQLNKLDNVANSVLRRVLFMIDHEIEAKEKQARQS